VTVRKQRLGTILRIIPKGIVEIDGFYIDYKRDNGNNTDKESNGKTQSDIFHEETTVTITSKKSVEEIHVFIEKIHKQWVEKNYPPRPPEDEPLYSFEQVSSDNGKCIFKNYKIPRTYILLEELFFDEKEELMRILDLFAANKIHRLGIMMSGEPGGGKTSLARAIAVRFNMHIVSINLNIIKNDAQLKDIVQGSSILYQDKGYTDWFTIPSKQRLYLLDDADCGSNVLLDRELKSQLNEREKAMMGYVHVSKDDDLSEDMISKYCPKEELTLQGILNVLDGITPMGGIFILNTNRPNDIDTAIKRPGRIDIELTLGRMSSEHVKLLVQSYGFDARSLLIPENLLMGCAIKNICLFAKNQEQFEEKLMSEIEHQIEFLEKKKIKAINHLERINKTAEMAMGQRENFMRHFNNSLTKRKKDETKNSKKEHGSEICKDTSAIYRRQDSIS
jgi:adenylate kinase family enzyme